MMNTVVERRLSSLRRRDCFVVNAYDVTPRNDSRVDLQVGPVSLQNVKEIEWQF